MSRSPDDDEVRVDSSVHPEDGMVEPFPGTPVGMVIDSAVAVPTNGHVACLTQEADEVTWALEWGVEPDSMQVAVQQAAQLYETFNPAGGDWASADPALRKSLVSSCVENHRLVRDGPY